MHWPALLRKNLIDECYSDVSEILVNAIHPRTCWLMQIASPASSVLGTGTAGRWTRTSGILCHPIQYHPGQGVVAMIPTR